MRKNWLRGEVTQLQMKFNKFLGSCVPMVTDPSILKLLERVKLSKLSHLGWFNQIPIWVGGYRL